MPLDEFLENRLEQFPEPRRSRLRQRLATSLAVLTARLHNSGMTHIDFHPGNVLVRLGPDEMPELSMIDLDALRQTGRLGWASARQNLALLDHYFWLRSSRTDRYRFLKTYLANRTEQAPDPRRFAQGIEDSTRAWAERLWRRWGRRCRSTNKYFRTFKALRSWSVASRDLDPVGGRGICWPIPTIPSTARARSGSRIRGPRRSSRRRCAWAASRPRLSTSGSTGRSGSIPGST